MAKLSTLILAAQLAFVGVAVPAAAEDDVRSVIVRYDDLNLLTASGRNLLTNRINLAVQTVCDSRPNYRPTLRERAQSQKCENLAMQKAEIKLANLFNGPGTRVADQAGVVVAAP